MRRTEDGCFFLPRSNPKLERGLDLQYTRCKGELRWIPNRGNKTYKDLKEYKNIYIVGKGPSLDNITADHFKDGLIICLNESIHKISTLNLKNEIIVLQQDVSLHDSCKGPKYLLPIDSYWYHDEEVYYYDTKDFDLKRSELSVIVAIEIAKFLKAETINLVSFDSCTTGDLGYTSVAKKGTKNPKRFLNHKEKILKHFDKINWITPNLTILSIFAMIKNEALYLEEWLDYHISIGIDHFYLYEDSSTDHTKKIAQKYEQVTIVPWFGKQLEAAKHFFSKFKTGWVACIDVDEFIWSEKPLKQLLEKYKDHGGVVANWTLVGSDGQENWRDEPVLKRFKKCARAEDEHVKSIIQAKYFKDAKNIHSFSLSKNAVTQNFEPVTGPLQKPCYGEIKIYHFFVKSRQEFQIKIDRGRPDIDKKRTMAEFYTHDKNEVLTPFKADLTLITCTGDRPEAFKLCENWIKNQTFKGLIQWIVVDDGFKPTPVTMGQTYIRETPTRNHTLLRNLMTALNQEIEGNILFIEDDDYYGPEYLKTFHNQLKIYELFGCFYSHYYNVKFRKWIQYSNSTHASLCATGIRKEFVTLLKEIIKESPSAIIDKTIWAQNLNKKLVMPDKLSVGIKGMPGRMSPFAGHKNLNSYFEDKNMRKLKELIGSDFKYYTEFIEQTSKGDDILLPLFDNL